MNEPGRFVAIALGFAILAAIPSCKAKPSPKEKAATVVSTADARTVQTDDTFLYWLQGGIFRRAKAGGATSTVVPNVSAQHFVVDATSVYWVDQDGGGRVAKAPKAGGVPAALAEQLGSGAALIGQDGDAIYVSLQGATLDHGVRSVSKTNGHVATVWNQSAWAAAADDASVYLAGDQEIARVPRTGGPATRVSKTRGLPRNIAVDDTKVYWTAGGPSALVLAAPKSGGEATVLHDEKGALPRFVATHAGAVYFTVTSEAGESVYRRAADGSTQLLTLVPKGGIAGFAVDDTSIYFTNGDGIQSAPAR